MIGQQVGEYRITARLGAGGMGVVYRGEHVLLGRPAAIKMLHANLSADREIVQRFFNEAKAASSIRHPGIVPVYTFGYHTDGTAYIAMEHLEGEGLAGRLGRLGKLPLVQAVRIVSQVASALGAAHGQGIVHRDLKPDNIFLVADPDVVGGERIQLLDFGIAKLAGDTSTRGYDTKTSAVFGTPAFMSPEQCRGAAQVDHRSDIYSLGCILYRCVCRRVPFLGELSGDVIASHIRDTPPAPRVLDPSIPVELEAMILRMLAKDPAQRYQTAADVRADLEALAAAWKGEPPVAAAESRPPPPTDLATADTGAPSSVTTLGASVGVIASTPAGGRGRTLAIGGAIAAVAAAAVITVVLASRGVPDPERKAAAVPDAAPRAVVVPPAAVDAGAAVATGARRAPDKASCDRALTSAAGKLDIEPNAASLAYQHLKDYRAGGDPARELIEVCVGEYDVELADCFTGAADAGAIAWCGDDFVRRECERGNPNSCASAAAIARDRGDLEKALALGTDSCERGAGEGCTVVGALAYYGQGTGVDLDRAFRSFSRAQALGDPRGASSAAEMLEHGIGVTPDPARALAMNRAACEIDPSNDACTSVAAALLDSDSRSRRAEALAMLEPLCKSGRARACTLLGDQGPRPDAANAYQRAHQLYELAREISPRAEMRLAELWRDGKGRAADAGRAAELLDAACKRHEPLACEQLSTLLVSGAVPLDLRRSRESAEAACKAGLAAGCARAECQRLFEEGRSNDDAWNRRVDKCRNTGALGPHVAERIRHQVRKEVRKSRSPVSNDMIE